MGKTIRHVPKNKYLRTPKGKKRALIGEVRVKAIPPSTWDDKVISALHEYKYVKRYCA